MKASISKSLRQLVWNRYIGERYGTGWCWCCRSTKINTFSFECGHVIAESKGGLTTVENLRPICGLCNRSMGSKNMIEFQEANGMTPSTFSKSWENAINYFYKFFW